MDQNHPSPSATLPSLASRRAGVPRPAPNLAASAQSPNDSSSPTGAAKRRRSEYEDGEDDARKLQGNKKACDQCRQQKLRCNVQQDENGSIVSCDRCNKRNLSCTITEGFKRTAKRDEHSAMEKRLAELEADNRQLRTQVQLLSGNSPTSANLPTSAPGNSLSIGPPTVQPNSYQMGLPSTSSASAGNYPFAYPSNYSSIPSSNSYAFTDPATYPNSSNPAMPLATNVAGLQYGTDMASNEADASQSLLRLAQRGHADASSNNRRAHNVKSIGDVHLLATEANELFLRYWDDFHPYLPLLDRQKDPEDYFKESQMLYWTVIFVASRRDEASSEQMKSLRQPVMQLIYSTISQNSQSYNIVKGLCLICTWPPHTSSTDTDPTFDLAGIMMAMAMRLGLHRPSHARDFTKINLVVAPAEVEDRLRTWAACNIVAQSVSTGYGQPSLAQFDYILSPDEVHGEDKLQLPSELRDRLVIELVVQRISAYLYRGPTDDGNSQWEDQRHNMVGILDAELKRVSPNHADAMSWADKLYLKAANLHLHLSVFFAPSTSRDYVMDLHHLYFASTDFLNDALYLELSNAPNYVMHMLLAAGFTILKLLSGFFAQYMDIKRSKYLLTACVHSLRDISVASNDLTCRLAEVLAQMSKASPVNKRTSVSLSSPSIPQFDGLHPDLDRRIPPTVDDSLKLRVKYRRSMSIVYDSVWNWREAFQGKGAGGNLDEAVRRPTDPDSGTQTPVPLTGGPQHQGDEMEIFNGLEGFEDFGAFDQTFDPLVGLPDVM